MGEPDLSPRVRETLRALHAGQASLVDLREVLRESEVVVPNLAGAGGGGPLSPPIMDADGEQAVPVFSSLETLADAAPEGTSYVLIAFEALLAGWPDQLGAVFDPGQEWTLHVPAHAMKEPAPIRAPAGSRAIVGEPAFEPEELLQQLRGLAHEPRVEAAWRAQVLLDGAGEIPHLAIGLRLTGAADEQAVLERVGRLAAAAADGPIDMIVVEPGSGDPIADYMLAREPFYRRDAG